MSYVDPDGLDEIARTLRDGEATMSATGPAATSCLQQIGRWVDASAVGGTLEFRTQWAAAATADLSARVRYSPAGGGHELGDGRWRQLGPRSRRHTGAGRLACLFRPGGIRSSVRGGAPPVGTDNDPLLDQLVATYHELAGQLPGYWPDDAAIAPSTRAGIERALADL